jgi:ATP-dependent helicase/nuclease subunit A
MSAAVHPQQVAADPAISAFVTANAGSGKTSTLVGRVARLLLRGAAPQAILCVTYTKAAAAEMQSRLFERLGDWSIYPDADLRTALEELGEDPDAWDLSQARALFARALETPGGLKIQTIHAFCEKLLRRFPIEAGVSPGFTVLEDAAAAEVSAGARDQVAAVSLARPDGDVGRAYAWFAVELDAQAFDAMFRTFEAERAAIGDYFARCGGLDGVITDVWNRCGFHAPVDEAAFEREVMAAPAFDETLWRRGAEALQATGGKQDGDCAAKLFETLAAARAGEGALDAALRALFTKDGKGTPIALIGKTKAFAARPDLREALLDEQTRLGEARMRRCGLWVARDTVHALSLARAYAALYEGEKARRGGLDFADLIERTKGLVAERPDAAWVLFKLDGGVDHVLVDEAQDTAPEQWTILDALTADFFAGEGARERGRTVFAVGDEKQSIYSFQGAEPERFLAEADRYGERARAADARFERVPLLESWRSTPEVLGFVDAVFADPAAGAGLTPGQVEAVRHLPRRPAGDGCVDLWPLEQGDAVEEVDAWAPVDAEPAESADKKLARRIAREIRAMVDRGDAVFDKRKKRFRAAEPGDVLILVRRRSGLFFEIIRALKREGLPVGGADRMNLSEHIVFDDLLALARFALFPSDDLTVAELLRSPFCGVSEESLFDLAYDREGGLWAALSRRGDERPEWADARAFLGWAKAEAQARSPFDFYSRLLGRLDPAGRSARRRMLTRLGREAEDALDEFLAQAATAEAQGVRDLERFAAAMARRDVEVKRELEDGKGEVRVMTVHGSKGLEAPVVILPDTTTRATPQGGPLLETDDGAFLWAPRKGDDCEASAAARELRERKGAEESSRLLYVALTRARDRLIVCGVEPGRPALWEGSWHDYVSRAFVGLGDRARPATVGDLELQRFGADPAPAAREAAEIATVAPLPAWIARRVETEAGARWASPSSIEDEAVVAAPSPLAGRGGLGRFRRGELIHKLFQVLPDLPADARRDAAGRLLERERDVGVDQRAEMIAAVFGVLDDPRFAAVFGPGSRAEVALAGSAPELPAGVAVSGRLDRLVVDAERVLVIDYKTNRPAPDRAEDADLAYLRQMSVYVAVLRAVYPGRRVEAALVWTDGPRLTPLSPQLVDQVLAGMRRSG